ncbi:hypothetical protein FRC02_005649 [Tulasnella sp. 418]|nr:hypothetical protein FRC02_005649 [Tulasnella sp. 418]
MSLKRFANSSVTATADFQSEYILPRDDVDAFAKEGTKKAGNESTTSKGGKQKGKRKRTAETEEQGNNGDNDDVEMEVGASEVSGQDWVIKNVEVLPDLDSTTGAHLDPSLVCVERWKANADDTKKGTFSCFDESGIFVALCRHGHLLYVADMVASGELAKYPLAVLSKIQEVFPEEKKQVWL